MRKEIFAGMALLAFLLGLPVLAERPYAPERDMPVPSGINPFHLRQNPEFRGKMIEARESFHEQLRANREKFLEEIKTRKEEWRAVNRERRMKFCEAARHMVGERFAAAIRNLERAQARLDEILAKFEAEGEDVGEAEALLQSSKQKLDDAKDKVAEIQALIPDGCESITAEIWAEIKVKAREAKDLLKESHGYLVDAIKVLKGLKGESEEESE